MTHRHFASGQATSPADADGRAQKPPLFDTRSFRGDFGLSINIRRETFEEVQAIAEHLLMMLPNDVFRINQHIARVKISPLPPPTAPPGGDRPGRHNPPRSPARANDQDVAA